jgi:hypothetical protein
MPSHLHEVLVSMFRDRPTLAADVLAGPLGVAVPAFTQAQASSGDLTDAVPTEYRADVVITLSANGADDNAGGDPVLAVVVEAQLRVDPRKRRSWPAYVATLHARLGCPVALLVVCPSAAVAARCGEPIVFGEPPGVVTPLVLGPGQVPVVTDPVRARRNPELAVLSALAHGGGPDQRSVVEAVWAALEIVDHDHATLYADVLLTVLPAAARDYLEAHMATTTGHRYHSDFARRYFDQGEAKGEAKGEARAVLAFLDARGIEVPDELRERIVGCTDLEQLDTWVRRAATASTAQDLFA